MRGPATGSTRLHAPVDAVRDILRMAADGLTSLCDVVPDLGLDLTPVGPDDRTRRGATLRLHRAEQVLLLARLAADTGARRGELAALQLEDLDGDVLTSSRGTSSEVVGPTKSGRIRRLTLGATTAALWRSTVAIWRDQNAPVPLGPWLFSQRLDHGTRLTTSCTGNWFTDLADRAGHPDVTLRRLRRSIEFLRPAAHGKPSRGASGFRFSSRR